MNLSKLMQHRKSKKIAHADNISVFEHHPYRWILFNYKFIQSMIDIKHPHRIILPYLHYFLIFARKIEGPVLLLGLGGGSAVHVLFQQDSSRHITIIEKHAGMIELAQKFFLIPNSPTIHLFCQSAEAYLANSSGAFKHILIDLGDEHGYPLACKTKLFFETVAARLAPDGIVCLNLSSYREIAEIKAKMTEVFTTPPLMIEAESNWILVHAKQGKTSLLQFLQDQALIKSHFWAPESGETIELRAEKYAFILRKIKAILATLTKIIVALIKSTLVETRLALRATFRINFRKTTTQDHTINSGK